MLLNCGVGEDSWESLGQRRSNQSILKEISPEYSLEGLMLTLKLQFFGYLMWRTDSFEKTLMLGKIEGRRRRRRPRMRWLDGITDLMDMFEQALGIGDGQPSMLQSMGSQRVGHDQATELMTNSQLIPFSTVKSWKHSKIKNKTRMSIIATFIQHSFGSPSHSNQKKKKEK